MAANSAVSEGIQPKFELIQAFMTVLFTCKNEKDPVKNEGARVITTFLTLRAFGILPMVPLEILPMVANGTIGNQKTLNVSRQPMVPMVPKLPLVATLVPMVQLVVPMVPLVSPMVSTVI